MTADKTLAKSIGRAIAQHRISVGLTQEEVAVSLGLGNEAVSRIERGVAMPSLQRLYELANLFDCQAVDLLTEGSPHVDDQVRHLRQMIEPLKAEDRDLILRWVEQLSSRLSR